MSTILIEKLSVPQLAKKFPAFYGNQRFMTVFTRAHHTLSQKNLVYTLPSYLFEVHFNISSTI